MRGLCIVGKRRVRGWLEQLSSLNVFGSVNSNFKLEKEVTVSSGIVNDHYLSVYCSVILCVRQNKFRGLSPRANYTDRATAACRRS
jgi:hypothetical protein